MALADDGEANDLLVGVSLPFPHPPHPIVGSPIQDVPFSFSFIQGFDSLSPFDYWLLIKNLLTATCQGPASVKAEKGTINI